MPLVGICAGGVGQPTSLPRPMEPVHRSELSRRSRSCAQRHLGRRIPPLAPGLSSARRPAPACCRCLTTPQLCMLSADGGRLPRGPEPLRKVPLYPIDEVLLLRELAK